MVGRRDDYINVIVNACRQAGERLIIHVAIVRLDYQVGSGGCNPPLYSPFYGRVISANTVNSPLTMV